jgi:hypothetical protein
MTTVSQNLQNAAVEYTNQPDTHIDLDGDVWDGRGFWWNDDKKRHFLEHIQTARPHLPWAKTQGASKGL